MRAECHRRYVPHIHKLDNIVRGACICGKGEGAKKRLVIDKEIFEAFSIGREKIRC